MNSNAYANLTQLKSAGWLDITVTTYDSDLIRMLCDASRAIDNLVSQGGGERFFYTREETRYFDGGGQSLFVSDILSISALSADIDGSGSWGSSFATSDYLLYPLNNYPKQYLKLTNRSSYSSFASNIRQGMKITGVFGYGDGSRASPWDFSNDVVLNTTSISAAGTSLIVTNGGNFAVGQTIRFADGEQCYISAISGNTLTIRRAQNGTIGAIHLNGVQINVAAYPGPITELTLIQASRWWKRRETAFADVSGNPELGTYTAYKGLDPDIKIGVANYIKKGF